MENLFEILMVLVFGAVFGSYGTLFAYRLPRGESCFGRYFGKKSRCPNCGVTILTRDLIPIINWIITCGKCRSCKTKIPRIHLFVELSTTILFLFCYLNYGFTEIFVINCLIASSMVVIMACDFTHKKFTDQALIFLLFFCTINRILYDQILLNIVYSLVLGILASVIIYKLVYKRLKYIFLSEEQIFDYIKLILIASIALEYQTFIFYFFEVLFILTILSIFKLFNKRNIISIGYVFVFPLMWMLIIQPINY